MTRFGALGLTLLLVACGGGGAGSFPGGFAAPGAALPTGGPVAPATVAGTVVDYDSGAPVQGAKLTIATAAGTTTTTAGADGSFSFPAPPGSLAAITVWAPGYAISLQGYTANGSSIRPVRLVAIAPEIVAWLASVNGDRAANGNPAPLVLNNELQIAARAQAANEDTAGYQGHWNTGGQSAADQCALAGALACAQNGGYALPTTAAVEAAYLAEKANCPGGTAAGCPFADDTGHFINLVTSNGYVGLGVSHQRDDGYTQDFAPIPAAVADPDALPAAGNVGTPISVTFRALAAGNFAGNVYWTTCPWQAFTAAQLLATEPASPYPANCTTTSPQLATTTRSPNDAALYTVSATPAVPGTYAFGLASGSAWAAFAVVNVPK